MTVTFLTISVKNRTGQPITFWLPPDQRPIVIQSTGSEEA